MNGHVWLAAIAALVLGLGGCGVPDAPREAGGSAADAPQIPSLTPSAPTMASAVPDRLTAIAPTSMAQNNTPTGSPGPQPERKTPESTTGTPGPEPATPPAPGPTEAAGPAATIASIEARVVADLAARLNVPADRIRVVQTAARTWPDESLGCRPARGAREPRPTPGYAIALSAAGRSYTYHTDMAGRFVRCEAPSKPIGPITGGTD